MPKKISDYSVVKKRVLQFIESPHEDRFIDVLNEIITYQRKWNAPLAAFWRKKNFLTKAFSPDDVPAVPTDVFKFVKLATSELSTPIVFRTSGTTLGDRGAHWHHCLAPYDLGAIKHFKHCVLPDQKQIPFLSLVLDPKEAPDSSLSYMVGILAKEFASSSQYFVTKDGVQIKEYVKALSSFSRQNMPVLLIGTAFAFAQLFDEWRGSLRLPTGSRIVETGGFKGKTKSIERAQLYQLFSSKLGVPSSHVVSEYSMTELSSQLYSGTLRRTLVDPKEGSALLGPHWLHVSIIDPHDHCVLPKNKTGLIRFIDLANVDSVVAVQTSDLGWIDENGLHLIGRAENATLRGCSLTIEEYQHKKLS